MNLNILECIGNIYPLKLVEYLIELAERDFRLIDELTTASIKDLRELLHILNFGEDCSQGANVVNAITALNYTLGLHKMKCVKVVGLHKVQLVG